MSGEAPPKKPKFKRRQIYVHKLQMSYAVGLGLMLFAYSLILFAAAFVVPYLYRAVQLLSTGPLEQQATAATQMLLMVQDVWPALLDLLQKIWPALVALILAAAFFSIYLSHKVAGPLYRLQQSTKELASGNLAIRIRLRKGDELHDLADVANQALDQLDQAMGEIRHRGSAARDAVRAALDDLNTQAAGNQDAIQKLESAAKAGDQVLEVVQRFRLSDNQRET